MEPFDKNASLPPAMPTTQAGPSTRPPFAAPNVPPTPPPMPSPLNNSASGVDIPPELRPYYTAPAATVKRRRIGLFVLPIVVFLLVLALLVGGTLWLRHHSLSGLFGRGATSAPAIIQPKPTVPTPVLPVAPVVSTPLSAPNAPATPLTTDQTPSVQATQPSAVPKAGPSETIYVIAALTAVLSFWLHRRTLVRHSRTAK